MKILSTGQESTLGNYRELVAVFFGEQSPATKYIDDKISESPNGADEEVLPMKAK